MGGLATVPRVLIIGIDRGSLDIIDLLIDARGPAAPFRPDRQRRFGAHGMHLASPYGIRLEFLRD
jgi:hypothetical protein